MSTFDRRKLLFGLTLGAGATWWHRERLGIEASKLEGLGREAPTRPVTEDPPVLVCQTQGSATVNLPTTECCRTAFYIVQPEDARGRFCRGRAWGEFLHHAADVVLARLALVEVACASVADIEAVTGANVRKGAWIVVVDYTRAEARVESLSSAELDRAAETHWPSDASAHVLERMIDARIRLLSALVVKALGDAFVARSAQLEAKTLHDDPLLADEIETIAQFGARPTLAAASRASATLLMQGLGLGTERARLYEEGILPDMLSHSILAGLAALTRERVVHTLRPGGAWWAETTGCGRRTIARDLPLRSGCGMAMIPERSHKILQFLFEDEYR